MTTIKVEFIVKLTWNRKSITGSKMPPYNQEKILIIHLIIYNTRSGYLYRCRMMNYMGQKSKSKSSTEIKMVEISIQIFSIQTQLQSKFEMSKADIVEDEEVKSKGTEEV